MSANPKQCKGSPRKLSEFAKELYLGKKYPEALKKYSELIELYPNNAVYYVHRAGCYIMLKKYRDGLDDAKKCIELDSQLFKAYTRAIKCCLILGDISQAETTLTKMLEFEQEKDATDKAKKDLDYVKGYANDAHIAYVMGDYRKVVFCMDRCCDISPYCTWFKVRKAECLAYLRRYHEAQDIANNILHIDERNVDAMYVRAICLYFEGNIEKALAYFQQVLKLAPDYTKALQIYKTAKNLKQKKEEGNTAFNNQQYQRAYTLYTEALTVDRLNSIVNAKLHFNKAMAARKLGRINESVTECTEALQLNENYLKALLFRGSLYMKLEQYEQAVTDLEKACQMDKNRDSKRLLMDAKLALKKSKRKNYYKILGIDRNASNDDIKKAYRKRAMIHHPDRHPNATEEEKKEQEKMFKEIGEAYGILSDPKKRSLYNSGHGMFDGDIGFQDDDLSSAFQMFCSRGFTFQCG